MGQHASSEGFAPDELVFPYRWPMEIPGYVLAGISLAAAVLLAVPQLRDMLGAPVWVAWLCGAFAVFAAEESWRVPRTMPRWIAVSGRGIRWFQHPQIHAHPWCEFAQLERVDNRFYYNGQYSGSIHVVVLVFTGGERLPLAAHHVPHFDQLIAVIENRGQFFPTLTQPGASPAEAPPCNRFGW
jgi:hypothetical protein